MNSNFKREKVFYIVMILFYAIFPFALFFEVFAFKSTRATGDGGGKLVTEYYSLADLSFRPFPYIVGIIFIVLSLILAVLLVMDLVRGKFYTAYVKIVSGAVMILLAMLAHYYGIVLGAMFFMAICCNLFILSFDLKLNKNNPTSKPNNVIIYVPMYVIFMIMLVCGLTIFALF